MSLMANLPLTFYVAKRVVHLALEVLECQALYFKSRNPIDLALCKRRERDLKRLLTCIDTSTGTSSWKVEDRVLWSAPVEVQEWLLEHPEFANDQGLAPSTALPVAPVIL